jgi:hypothetical protein
MARLTMRERERIRQAEAAARTREAARRDMTRRALYGPDYAAMTEAEAEMEWRLRQEQFSEELRRSAGAGK